MRFDKAREQRWVPPSPVSEAGEFFPSWQNRYFESPSSQPRRDCPSAPYSRPSPTVERERLTPRPAFTAQEMRHSFAIEPLDKPSWFQPRPYLYMCVRCKWMFRINDSPGSVISLDGLGRQIPGPENSRRAATFASGPCPAFSGLALFAALPPVSNKQAHYFSGFVELLLSVIRSSRLRRHHRNLESEIAGTDSLALHTKSNTNSRDENSRDRTMPANGNHSSQNGVTTASHLSDDGSLAHCQGCAATGRIEPAIGRTTHPDYRQLDLCGDCISYYDAAKVEGVVRTPTISRIVGSTFGIAILKTGHTSARRP
jgi:hypothetical protein